MIHPPISLDLKHFVRIDPDAWIAQRVGAELRDLTAALDDFGHSDHFDDQVLPRPDWISLAALWCSAREYPTHEGGALVHDHDRLAKPMAVLLADAAPYGTIAIVSVDGETPTVYLDITSDDGYWYASNVVDIVCGCGQRWSWTGGEVTTGDGQCLRVREVFGDHLHTPFTTCPGCVAYDNDDTDTSCPCPGDDVIVCPSCGRRCRLELPKVPTIPKPRPYTVRAERRSEYLGWVQATDPADAETRAARLLDEGGSIPGYGHLSVHTIGQQFRAVPAGQRCWRCGQDPSQPATPICAHPDPTREPWPVPLPAVSVDLDAAVGWLHAPAFADGAGTNAAACGVTDDLRSDTDQFLHALAQVAGGAPGLHRRQDVTHVEVQVVSEEAGPVAEVVVDLANGTRLASPTLNAYDLTWRDSDACGVPAMAAALASSMEAAADLVARYEAVHPGYRQPADPATGSPRSGRSA